MFKGGRLSNQQYSTSTTTINYAGPSGEITIARLVFCVEISIKIQFEAKNVRNKVVTDGHNA